ncbi:MAG: hypothetical protein A2509_05950 [Candidatus Edwardsbacteria bacterium RIFOXYD12_FULL_50_11]|jgi:hypothetical protein|uniref:DUF2934 domain-containing protein n=1 Tax=Candidatus Edwardsbacteria bacterium GWF2_54_11 TaxID=1817851 RepID=A0A1F5RIM8_9BACT|nr:MAG: hypothetical protein A2502_10665 [Candidatus Edwardsbacteria bacterium RifOxyC12_full_54_24]OGF06708.1 MAG: hypothetical protein A2273_00400 [Candidatus Edwardsbacteria bacterium RifOxyA12_full_54_48]OGF10659.1 MAG: hypothetical protein A3K15_05765 [Candidatus Edwardsbacteria bacterium GWE2_54_12]OGF14224.1 MAG: hypothetical protein A2024_01985 [Candidatus Edwardsbacteria bacterium GWF2_54_11]OGF15440.1 MAG: hypothetical protein A2509_05950 [Candidatus Edwardsbacteria bacterium RIFOXYD1
MNTTKAQKVQPAITAPVSAGAPADMENLTRIKAHQMFEQRGRQPGRDLDDWLAAEKDLAGKPANDIKGVKGFKTT